MPSPAPPTFSSATEAERETYSYGQCMWFALAVHDRMGWPLEVVLDPDGSIGHAWVRLPDGRSFDVVGPGGAEDFIDDPTKVQRVTRDEMVALARGEEDHAAVAAAGAVFDRMRGLPVPSRMAPKPGRR